MKKSDFFDRWKIQQQVMRRQVYRLKVDRIIVVLTVVVDKVTVSICNLNYVK